METGIAIMIHGGPATVDGSRLRDHCGEMRQWIADPEKTPNAAETLEALTSLGTLVALGTPGV
ncbi:hypothetical protein [Rhodococcus jostii]|uniref:hypothetical protein n=1 Tax=Rhodococcus jostii TaxID=132919 RepID=UPI00364CD3B5